jgi:hypothetical protein
MSKKDSGRVRVLAVKDMFECIELCLIDKKGEPLVRFLGEFHPWPKSQNLCAPIRHGLFIGAVN